MMTTYDLVIDCGHGGKDFGASYNDRIEKEINLMNGTYLYERFQDLGVNCNITRMDDVTLENENRVNMAKEGYICFSCHMNASVNHNINRGEVIHSIFSDGKLAHYIKNEWEQAGQETRVFNRPNTKGTDYYYMHRLTGRTETLILEFAFMDNDKDYENYEQHRIEYLEGVIRAYCLYTDTRYTPPNSGERVNAPSQTLFAVQVGAFAEKSNALKLSDELQSKGYEVLISEITQK